MASPSAAIVHPSRTTRPRIPQRRAQRSLRNAAQSPREKIHHAERARDDPRRFKRQMKGVGVVKSRKIVDGQLDAERRSIEQSQRPHARIAARLDESAGVRARAP